MIMFMYGLNNISIYKKKNKTLIKNNDKKYILKKILNERRILEAHSLLNNKTEYYKIIPNIYGNIITQYKENKYILLNENTSHEIKSKDIYLEQQKYSNYSINHSNWEKLWTIKNNYYELNEEDNNYLWESKEYYIGLAENALQFLKINDIKFNDIMITKLSVEMGLYLDNVIIDCKEREIAEIIKYKFFYANIKYEELNKLIEKKNVKKILARLLYPNYYFDVYDQFINGKENINKIKNIISKTKKYEQFITYIYTKYGTSDIIMPEWLKT